MLPDQQVCSQNLQNNNSMCHLFYTPTTCLEAHSSFSWQFSKFSILANYSYDAHVKGCLKEGNILLKLVQQNEGSHFNNG